MLSSTATCKKLPRDTQSELTDQELELEVVLRSHFAVEGHSNEELLAATDHQVFDVVGGGEVVRFVNLLTHVDAVHRQRLWGIKEECTKLLIID